MNNRFVFKCTECDIDFICTIEQSKQKILCQDCEVYRSKFAFYIEDFKKELPLISNEVKVQRIIEYTLAMNEYATNLKISIDKNTKYFEKLIQLASNDFDKQYNYQKLKYDIYERSISIKKEEHKIRIDKLKYFTNNWDGSDELFHHPTQRENEHKQILLLIDNPLAYLNYKQPKSTYLNYKQPKSTPI
jgi:hypothetical protein